MKLELISDFETLQARRSSWDRAAGAFPFHRWAWLGNWFEYLGNNLEPVVLVAHGPPAGSVDGETDPSAEHWAGVAPLCIERTALGSKLKFWGTGSACTDYIRLITRDQDHQAFSFAVADWLREQTLPGGKLDSIDLIELEGHAGQEINRHFFEAMDANGFQSHHDELESCWVTHLPADWDSLNRRFSKSMRRKTKKATQRLADERTDVFCSNRNGLDELWPVFVQLHQKRRNSLGQPGCFSDPGFEKFLLAATQQLAKEQRAQLKVIHFEDQPLASMLLFNDVRTNYMYQSGVDTDRMKLEPGYQIALHAIECSIEDGFEFFDFLRGDEPYKARWDTVRTPIMRTRWVPRKLKSIVKHNLWVAGRAVKSYLRKPTS